MAPGDGGQYYYDLALDVSPTDADRQFAAGISVWRSENGGADWSLNAHWVTWAGEFTHDRYTHADVHDIQFFTRTDGTVDMWVASDGGLYYSEDEGDHIEPRMHGLHGTDFWGVASRMERAGGHGGRDVPQRHVDSERRFVPLGPGRRQLRWLVGRVGRRQLSRLYQPGGCESWLPRRRGISIHGRSI